MQFREMCWVLYSVSMMQNRGSINGFLDLTSYSNLGGTWNSWSQMHIRTLDLKNFMEIIELSTYHKVVFWTSLQCT